MAENKVYDCIIIGAGPGGLQAAIYLGRYHMSTLIIDRSGGRTWHAKHIENFLSQKLIAGEEIIEKGKDQARSFSAEIIQGHVVEVIKRETFEVHTHTERYRSQFVIAASGVYDILPDLENLYAFFGTSFFTCIDCDGYSTTGKKLVILGDSVEAVNHAFAMKEMYTGDITLIMDAFTLPPEYDEELTNEGIRFIQGQPVRLIGKEHLEAIELKDGQHIPCEVIMSTFGYRLNDEFLTGLSLKKNQRGFYITNDHYESSLSGLYIIGPLNTGHDQVVVAAGEGAVAAIEIKNAVLERRKMAFFQE